MTTPYPSPLQARRLARSAPRQHGATLIELMVGITIGLLTIAVAMGAITVSRGVSGTITDASQLQQQASYAFRVLGQQLRQAGSMQLNLAANKNPGDPIDPADVVAFTPLPTLIPIAGKDSPASSEYTLSLAYQNYKEKSVTASSDISLFRDCLGEQKDPTPTDPLSLFLPSQFMLDSTKGELMCAGVNNIPQAILRNVADFQVSYLIQTAALTGDPKIQTVNAATAGVDWTRVFGVEVCLVLYGDESINMPAGSTYTGCDGTNINMSHSGSLATNRKNRMHMAFRTIYQLRSQGLTG